MGDNGLFYVVLWYQGKDKVKTLPNSRPNAVKLFRKYLLIK
nr:MAG TPA: hypothetical protein [Caudoviricetes sp.]